MAPAKFYFFLIISFLVYNTSWATNYYVDKNASGSNNGTSWANAWESFASINWGSINPGDIIYISGGTDSTVYYEEFKLLNVDGTVDAPITIRNSWDSGHNGRVIIDGEDEGRNCIEVGDYGYEPSNIIFYGLELREGHYDIYVHVTAINITFDSMYVYDWNQQGFHTAGTDDNPWQGNADIDGIIIQNSTFISATNYGGDAITFNRSSNHIIRNNYVRIRNRQTHNSHIDGTLGIWCEGFRIYNNVFILDSNAQGQAYIIRAWADGANEDSVIVYNNYFYVGGVWDSNDPPWTSVVNVRWQSEGSQVKPPTFFAHNTIVSWGPWVGAVVHEAPGTWVNNIMVQFGDGITPSSNWLYNQRGTDAPAVDSMRNNLMWREFESLADQPFFTGTWEGNGTSAQNFYWSTWVNTLGGTGINVNPLFVDDIGNIHGEDQANISGELQAGSPAINQGEDIQAIIEGMGLPWTDINGNARDNTPDLGAYQYVPRGPDLTPPDVTGATLLDSIILKITFSEPLDPSTAQNPNNYSINNGITLVSALLTGSVVTLTTSPHSYGTYTVTVSNVEDIAGNIVSPTANSADYDWTVIQDVIPPEVVSAEVQDSVTLKVIFSELLEQSSAQNKNNYSITNGINVLTASLSGSQVILTTSDHSAGSYSVTVNNVTDLAGNLIDPNNNSADYEVIEYTDSVNVSLRSFLEGPYNDDAMLNDLSDQNLIPLTQPYYDTPWNYPGDESVSEIPNEVVDWVLLEIRSGIEISSIVARRAAFLVIDGTIKDLNGESTVEFPEVSSGHYYVVVHHRNHLSIMTKDPIYLSESSELYDFTTSLEKAYGNQPMKQLAGGKFGLYAADGNANGNINRADNKSIWRKQNGSVGYKSGDYDMNGGVNIRDKNAVYKPNKGRNTGVPMN